MGLLDPDESSLQGLQGYVPGGLECGDRVRRHPLQSRFHSEKQCEVEQVTLGLMFFICDKVMVVTIVTIPASQAC